MFAKKYGCHFWYHIRYSNWYDFWIVGALEYIHDACMFQKAADKPVNLKFILSCLVYRIRYGDEMVATKDNFWATPLN